MGIKRITKIQKRSWHQYLITLTKELKSKWTLAVIAFSVTDHHTVQSLNLQHSTETNQFQLHYLILQPDISFFNIFFPSKTRDFECNF